MSHAKNRKATKPDQWLAGYATALANVSRTLSGLTTDTIVVHVLIGDGITLADLIEGGAEPYDTDQLAHALRGSDPTSCKARGKRAGGAA